MIIRLLCIFASICVLFFQIGHASGAKQSGYVPFDTVGHTKMLKKVAEKVTNAVTPKKVSLGDINFTNPAYERVHEQGHREIVRTLSTSSMYYYQEPTFPAVQSVNASVKINSDGNGSLGYRSKLRVPHSGLPKQEKVISKGNSATRLANKVASAVKNVVSGSKHKKPELSRSLQRSISFENPTHPELIKEYAALEKRITKSISHDSAYKDSDHYSGSHSYEYDKSIEYLEPQKRSIHYLEPEHVLYLEIVGAKPIDKGYMTVSLKADTKSAVK